MTTRAGMDTATGRAVWLRRDAERIGGTLPPLLAEAERLAATIAAGVHGRRRAGPGEEFWQYRQALPGDVASAIDWRRSARSDHAYIREMEWDAAQTVTIWADTARAMDYQGPTAPRSKGERARLLALALAVLLVRGGERVAFHGTEATEPKTGEQHLRRLALALSGEEDGRPDYGAPLAWPGRRTGRAVLLSDFLGPLDAVEDMVRSAAAGGVAGVLVQINDPAEEQFPFDGRTRFRSMAGVLDFETERARALKDNYVLRLAERRDTLARIARAAGWQVIQHHTDVSPRVALLSLYTLLRGAR
ncbi:uncharacterized protein (DUF58 family) [Rubricella aquisinus]|uniref:Uncharacterized protein (DUF58 family) n=1 Tax=Rubricella aquisinus TaxID=2028108 RepID=A0A840X356_9RHOB|nr:DUF58 domain-containing protein [Rubricella aquisinus]MBB5515107.1 uncharacterized protein (DUF58 family) [Rubricella aquisinus]